MATKRAPTFAKFGPIKRDEYLEALRGGARRGAAAESVGVSAELVRLYVKAEPVFESARDDAESDANELVEDALFIAATSGNVTACQVWLYNRAPSRWADRRAVAHTGADGGPIIVSELSDDERRARMVEVKDELERRLKIVPA